MNSKNSLAINGGNKIRNEPMPHRKQFGRDELNAVIEVFEDSWHNKIDFGYQGKYEQLYTDNFCAFHGGGYADAVSSGTAAIYLALKTLDLPEKSDVIVSPVTDPGSISPIILQNLNIIVADSQERSFNIGPEEFKAAITPNTKCAIITHTGGIPCEIDIITHIAHEYGIKIIEDCSQAHGAIYKDKRVGCFGDISVFSTMFSKNHSTGGSGGVVYTRNEKYYWKIRALADRGKAFDSESFDPKNPSDFLFPALNFNLDEISCAIGVSTLSHLETTIKIRNQIVNEINKFIRETSCLFPVIQPPDSVLSPFFLTVGVCVEKITVSKEEFATAIIAEGIDINPHYKYVVSEWKWLKPYLQKQTIAPNAVDFSNLSFNILFNEKYTNNEIDSIKKSITKVEEVYARSKSI